MLEAGTKFDTQFEQGCIVTMTPEDFERTEGIVGFFLALDHEGVECQYSTQMVIGHPNHREV